MRIHYIQHVDFEDLGIIATWAKQSGHIISGTKIYQGESLPVLANFDVLISLGGPQSPLAYTKYPYLKDERDLIKTAIHANKYVVGFCLGAQLIGEALGEKTEKSPHKEVGMFPVDLTESATVDPIFKDFPNTFVALHWHNDMPGIPKDAKVIAISAGCPRQIIRINKKVYAFQCHLEPLYNGIEKMCMADPTMLGPSEYTQTPTEMLAADHMTMNQLAWKFFDRWLGRA